MGRLGRRLKRAGAQAVDAQAAPAQAAQGLLEGVEPGRLAVDVDHRRRADVAHAPGQPRLARQPRHLGPQAHALHDALQFEAAALGRGDAGGAGVHG